MRISQHGAVVDDMKKFNHKIYASSGNYVYIANNGVDTEPGRSVEEREG